MNWRAIGDAGQDAFIKALAGTPLQTDAAKIYTAVDDHSILYLAHLKVESDFGREGIAPSTHNPTGLRPRGGDGFLSFATWVDAAREWFARVIDPNYAYAKDVTVEDYVHSYAPSSDGNNEAAYVAAIMATYKQYAKTEATPVTTPPKVTFGRVPKPPIVELICTKEGEGHGYNTVAPRKNVGICEHITDGRGSIEFYHDFFSIGGEREADALVDFVVGRDGRIGMLNDWRGTRAPWANGNTLGPEGDGPAFLAQFGNAGVNNKLVSIEHEGAAAEDWTGAQWNASVALDAWLMDQMEMRFDTYPVHQEYGIVTHLFHSEFTNKGGNTLDECPGRYIKTHIDQFDAEVKAVMMAHQLTDAQAASDPKVPTVPWGKDAIGVQRLGSVDVVAYYGAVTALRRTPVRVAANDGAAVLAYIAEGSTGIIRGGFANTANVGWALIDLGPLGVGRARMSAFKERYPVAKNRRKS